MHRFIAAAVVVASVSAAGAQIVVTPPGPRERAEFEIPPRRPRLPDQETVQRAIRERNNNRGSRIDVATLELRGLERPLDAPEGYDGPPPTYEVNLHYVALRRNPLIGPADRDAVREVVARRYGAMQAGVPENLETYLDIDDGLIEMIDLADIESLGSITRRLQTILESGFLTQSLRQAGVISREAAEINSELLRRYQQAQNRAGGGVNNELFRALMRDSVREPVDAFNALLYEGSTRWDGVLAGLELPGDARRRLRRTATEPGGGGPPTRAEIDAKANRVKLAWRTLDLEQKQALVRRILETRPAGEGPIVPALRLTYPGKRVLTLDELVARQERATGDGGAAGGG